MSIQYVAEMYMELGEAIHIRSVVKPKCEQDLPFSIRSARWELLDGEGVIEDSGECAINGHEIDAFVSPGNIGTYKLRYTYQIADETWVDIIKIMVN